MKLAVNVHFSSDGAVAAGVAFDTWDAPEASKTYLSRIVQVEKSERGALDLRALPCVLQLLREHALDPEVVVIDGFVHLDAQETAGWGQHLFHALEGRTPVIGVSKSAMGNAMAIVPTQFEVIREEETQPLIVTCVGIDLASAKARLRTMHGRRRMPTLLELVARLAKGTAA